MVVNGVLLRKGERADEYREFMKKLVESIFDDRKLYKLEKDLLEYVEKKSNPFTQYLCELNKIIKKYKINSNFTHLFPRVREHLWDEGLSEALSTYRKTGKNLEEAEIYLALTLAHVISHNNARSVKLSEEAVEETAEAVNNYLKSKGLVSLKIKQLENNEPSEIFDIVMQKTYKFLSAKYQLC